jgi:hypothetical protein
MATRIEVGLEMRFEIDPTPEENRRACAAILQASLPPSRANLIVIALYAAVGVAAYSLTPATWVTTFAIGILGIAACTLALQAEARSRVRRLQVNDPHASEHHFLELTPSGVRAWCEHVDARYPWQDFTKVTENKEFYLLVRPSGTGSALPKRLLDQGRDAELRALLREWSPDRGAALTGK